MLKVDVKHVINIFAVHINIENEYGAKFIAC